MIEIIALLKLLMIDEPMIVETPTIVIEQILTWYNLDEEINSIEKQLYLLIK